MSSRKRSRDDTDDLSESSGQGFCWRKLFSTKRRIPNLGPWPTVAELREAGAEDCWLQLVGVERGSVMLHVVEEEEADFRLLDYDACFQTFRVGGRKFMPPVTACRLRQSEQRRLGLPVTPRRSRELRRSFFVEPYVTPVVRPRVRKFVSIRLRAAHVKRFISRVISKADTLSDFAPDLDDESYFFALDEYSYSKDYSSPRRITHPYDAKHVYYGKTIVRPGEKRHVTFNGKLFFQKHYRYAAISYSHPEPVRNYQTDDQDLPPVPMKAIQPRFARFRKREVFVPVKPGTVDAKGRPVKGTLQRFVQATWQIPDDFLIFLGHRFPPPSRKKKRRIFFYQWF